MAGPALPYPRPRPPAEERAATPPDPEPPTDWTRPISSECYTLAQELETLLLSDRCGRPPHPAAVQIAELLARQYGNPLRRV